MTVTSLPPGSPVPRRPLTRRLLATLAVAALAFGVVVPAAAASAATPTPSPTASPSPASLALAPGANGILRPNEPLTAVATVQNPGTSATAAGTVTFSFSTTPLRDRTALERWLSGDTSGVALQPVGTAALDAVSPGAQASATLTVAPTDPALAGRGPGVYPLLAQAGIGSTLGATSVVVVPNDAAPAAPVALVVPITAKPLSEGLLTASELAAQTAVDGPLTAELDAVDGTNATLAVDPAIPAAIRVLGTSAPPTAVAWLQRLLALPNDRFALQFGDADLAAQVYAGVTAPLAPTSLLSYMKASDFTSPAPAVSAVSTPAPTSSPTPGSPALPDLSTLLDIGAATGHTYWPATGSAGSAVVSALGAQGTADSPARVLVPTSVVSSGPDSTVAAAATSSGVETAVYDTRVSAALTAAAGQSDATLRGASLADALAYLTFARAEAGGRPVLAVIDRGVDRSRASLRAAVTTALGSPGSTAVSLDGALAQPRTAVTLSDVAADATRVADVSALLSDEQSIARFATILSTPELLTGRERAEMLQVLSVSWTGDAARQTMTAHRAATQQTLGAVGILSSDFRLVSSSAPLRPWVRNDLPWPITVDMRARPNDVRLRVQADTRIQAQASANTRVEVPVEARIANGEVTVGLQLYSPTGERIGAPQRVDVEVRAEWENIGLVIVIVLVVVFIGVGVGRQIGRRRAARRARDTPDAMPSGPTDGDDVAASAEASADAGASASAETSASVETSGSTAAGEATAPGRGDDATDGDHPPDSTIAEGGDHTTGPAPTDSAAESAADDAGESSPAEETRS